MNSIASNIVQCTEPDCDESFTKHNQLRTHLCTVHAPPGTKPFQCSHKSCTKSFDTNQHLRTHMRTHNGWFYLVSGIQLLTILQKNDTHASTTHVYPPQSARLSFILLCMHFSIILVLLIRLLVLIHHAMVVSLLLKKVSVNMKNSTNNAMRKLV